MCAPNAIDNAVTPATTRKSLAGNSPSVKMDLTRGLVSRSRDSRLAMADRPDHDRIPRPSTILIHKRARRWVFLEQLLTVWTTVSGFTASSPPSAYAATPFSVFSREKRATRVFKEAHSLATAVSSRTWTIPFEPQRRGITDNETIGEHSRRDTSTLDFRSDRSRLAYLSATPVLASSAATTA
ncbi:hypothetical protein WN48_07004 [Eufriesea mexicana]|uniref:Uncharacterized protein n=1 Tax=Eufriesea mexicana TaxID=516756 RepID=A0A310SIX5_9HYME|nr:hypothetical protein WN48_07004 [Eufriesea mexicana]